MKIANELLSACQVVTSLAKRMMLVIISFSGVGILNEYENIAKGYLQKYLDAKNIQKTLVQDSVSNTLMPDKNSKLLRQLLLTYSPSTSRRRFLEF